MVAPSAQLTPAVYNAVKVLMICWKDSAQSEFEKQLNALSKEFKAYRFDVEPVYKIESEKPHQRLNLRLQEFLQNDQKGTLLIVYYGGHGENSQDRNNVWLR